MNFQSKATEKPDISPYDTTFLIAAMILRKSRPVSLLILRHWGKDFTTLYHSISVYPHFLDTLNHGILISLPCGIPPNYS